MVCLLMLKYRCLLPAVAKWLQAVSSAALSHSHFHIIKSELPDRNSFIPVIFFFFCYCWTFSSVFSLIAPAYLTEPLEYVREETAQRIRLFLLKNFQEWLEGCKTPSSTKWLHFHIYNCTVFYLNFFSFIKKSAFWKCLLNW